MPEDGEVTSQRLFGDDRPLHFEIGFGGGEHLAYRADLLPDHGFIGAEPFLNGVAQALVTCATAASLATCASSTAMRCRCSPDARRRADVLYLLHPDPWPKARHAKRRMMNDGPLRMFADKLKPGGEFRFGTDHAVYLRHALMVMRRFTDEFEWVVEGRSELAEPPLRLARDPLRTQGPHGLWARGVVLPLPPAVNAPQVACQRLRPKERADRRHGRVSMSRGLRRAYAQFATKYAAGS